MIRLIIIVWFLTATIFCGNNNTAPTFTVATSESVELQREEKGDRWRAIKTTTTTKEIISTIPSTNNQHENQEGKEEIEEDERSLLDVFGEAAKEYLTQRVIPETDEFCRFDWKSIQCEPHCHCQFQFQWGDFHFGRSCRLRQTGIIQSEEYCQQHYNQTHRHHLHRDSIRFLQLIWMQATILIKQQQWTRRTRGSILKLRIKAKQRYRQFQTNTCRDIPVPDCNNKDKQQQEQEQHIMMMNQQQDDESYRRNLKETLFCRHIPTTCDDNGEESNLPHHHLDDEEVSTTTTGTSGGRNPFFQDLMPSHDFR